MQRALPPWAKLWDNYPDSHDSNEVKRLIGGRVDAPWIQNTCTIRLSRALNYAGDPVPAGFAGLNVVSGVDRKWYAYRVREMRKYLEARYGPPAVKSKGSEARSAVIGKRGIIMFDVQGWNDATGHFDLWDGERVRYSEYFDKAREVLLWIAP